MMFSSPTHFLIEKVTQRVSFEYAFDTHFGSRASGCGLDGNGRQTKPSLNDVAGQMNVLNPAVRQIDFPPEQDSPTHRHSIVIKPILQCFIFEEHRKKKHDETRP